MSFKRRLSLSMVALVLALTAVLSLVYLRHLLRIQLQFAFQQANVAAEHIETAMMDILSAPPPASSREETRAFWRQAASEELKDVIDRSLSSFNTLIEIAVTDEQGEVLASFSPQTRWRRRPPFQDLADKGFLEQLRLIYARPREYEVSRILGYEGRPVLVGHVVVSTSTLRKQLDPLIRELVVAALLSLLASLVLAVVFSGIAFRPLDRLGQAIDRMTRGEFALPPPADDSRRDEYTVIASKLSMLGQQFRDAREGISSLRGNMEQVMRRLEGGVFLFDAEDRLIIASAGAESFLGQGRWQMMGQSLEEVFPAGAELGELVVSAVRLRQPIESQMVELEPGPVGTPEGKPEETPAGAPDGASRERPARVLLSVELMEDFASRRRMGTLVVLRDAETRHQIQTEMEVSTRLAAISRLTSGVAHEIKNPLNAIALHLELLKNRVAGKQEPPPKELDVIAREIARLDHVVKTFLDFTRPVDLRLAEVRLDKLVEEIAQLAKPEAVTHQVRIDVLNGCSDSVIRADRDLLKQAVLNLAVNGIQAMPQGGELKLALSRVGSEVELAVTDQGVGIAPEDRDKIFRLYYTTKKKGSGIGLAMTFRVVQLHNGTIDFSSEPGRGTTFRMRFPVVEVR